MNEMATGYLIAFLLDIKRVQENFILRFLMRKDLKKLQVACWI